MQATSHQQQNEHWGSTSSLSEFMNMKIISAHELNIKSSQGIMTSPYKHGSISVSNQSMIKYDAIYVCIRTHTHSTFMEVSKMPTVAYTVLMKNKDGNVQHVDKNHLYRLLSDTSCGLSSLNYSSSNFDFLKWHCTLVFKLS